MLLLDEGVEDAEFGELKDGTQDGIVDAPDCAGDVVPTWLETVETVPTSDSSSLGLDSASATTLAFPWRYCISVVNSEMHASW